MSDFHLNLMFGDRYTIFDLHETAEKEDSHTITLGDKTYVVDILSGTKEDIDDLFKRAQENKIRKPEDLSLIKKILYNKVQVSVSTPTPQIKRLKHSTLGSIIERITTVLSLTFRLLTLSLYFANFKIRTLFESKKVTGTYTFPHITPRVTFTKLEVTALSILYDPHPLTNAEKKTLRQFFSSITNNNEFNKKMTLALKKLKDDDPFKEILTHLREYSFKSKHFEKIDSLKERFERIGREISTVTEATFSEEERVSLHEFQIVQSLFNMSECLQWIESLAVWPKNSPIQGVRDKMEIIKKGIEQIDDQYNKGEELLVGALFFKDIAKVEMHENKSFRVENKGDLFEKAHNWLHKYNHVDIGCGITTRRGFPAYLTAGMFMKFNIQRHSFNNNCDSRILRPNFRKMLGDKNLALLCERKKCTEEKVLQDLETYYQEKVNSLFTNITEKFQKLENSDELMTFSILKENTASAIDPKEIPQNLEKEQKIFCSAFAGQILLYALDAVNCEVADGLMQIPIRTTENWDALHPDRLENLLKPFCDEIPQPKFIDYILKRDQIAAFRKNDQR